MTEHIKIKNVPPRVQYIADGILTTYELPFALFQDDNLTVYWGDQIRDKATYTLTRTTEGGTVSFAEPPPADTVITLARNLTIERTTDFQEGGALRADTLNDEFDYQTACHQQLADALNRSMILPPYAVATNVNLTLPLPAAGKAIVWNRDGTNLENSTVAVNDLDAAMQTAKNAAETAAATASAKAGAAQTAATNAAASAATATTNAALFQQARTNCLTQMPQHITLKVSAGSVTCKAGSRLFTPAGLADDGTAVFTPWTLATDLSVSAGTATDGDYFLCHTENGLILGTNTTLTYNPATNVIGTGGYSLPLGIITVQNGSIQSVRHVFNGLGYLGSFVFLLPGVQGIVADGLNSDGTLASKTVQNDTVKITKMISPLSGRQILWHGDSLIHFVSYNIGTLEPHPANTTYDVWYHPVANEVYVDRGTWQKDSNFIPVATVWTDSNTPYTVQRLTPRTALHVVDYTEAGPLTFPQTGSDYMKLANGMMIQFGDIPIGQTDITLPQPFADNRYVVVATALYDSASQVAYYNRTTTGFQIHPNRNDYVVTYMAVGTWK